MKRLLTMALIVGLCSSHSLFAASLTKQSVNFSGNAKDIGVVNDADNLVFLQAINPSKPGFITQGSGEWGFATNDGSNTPDVAAIALQFNGAPALLGVPAESGTLTIGANNEIADLWTQRIYARPVVFVSFEDPNLNNGVSIVPTAPITAGNQFLFDVRQTDGFGADLTGAKLHYLVAEEGWHRLADGRMLLISSAEVKHTGFTGKTIELGASFTDAVTVAQLQRPMLFKNSLGFRQLFDMAVYQGATVTSGVGDFDSIGLRLMQQNGVEATTSDTVYAGRIGFMVLGHISNIANKFKTVRDTNTNIRGGSYLTVPQANFQYYPHSAAATPLLNKAACAEDDDVQNFCTYLSLPVDAMSRGTFDTPRLPYMNSDFEPLQMQRTLYSEIEGSWEGTAEAELATPVTDGDGKAIVGTLARMYPNLVAARGWDAVLIGSNSYWHWFATYHYNTCVFDSMNTACVDYTPGESIVKNSSILWDASTVRYDPDDNKYIGAHPSTTRAQELFIATDTGRNDRGTYVERLTPKSWEASDTFDYLKFKVPDNNKFINLDNIQAASRELIETAAEPWQFAFIRTSASASESWCATCEGIPTFQTGAWKSSESKVYLVAVHSNAYYYGEGHANGSWIRPRVGKVGKSLRVGDYLFANIPIGVNVQDFYWLRSATGTRSDAVQIAYGELGYQATADDGNHYVTLCMDYDNSERCGDWFKVGNIPYATNIGVRTIAPTGVDLVGDYSYIAPGSGNYDVESRSPHRWQKLTNGVWQDISGETEQTYVARGSLGWQVRFCVIPRSLAGITGPEVCSAGIVVQGDNDSDGIADHWDSDDDNDGIFDWYDAFPMDRNEWVDTDRDGIGNNADLDDDNDGLSDEVENAGLTDPLKYDTDGDGTNDADDPFPTSYGNFPDFDNDGLDDTVDDDIDGDGVVDFVEITHNGQSVIRRVDDDPFRACVSNHITVTSNADSGPGSLRQALIDLCSGEIYSDLSIIDFSDAMTITLQSPLVINKGMEINGNREVILDAQGQHEVFHVAMKEGLASTQFPYLVGLTLRNGISTQLEENQIAADRSFGSAINVQSSPYVMLHTVFIENMTAPAIAGDSLQLYLENSLVANVQGNNAALVVEDGHIALFSSTIVNSEGGTISLVGEGKAQLRNSLLLKGANGSTVCNVEIWEQQSASWVEDSECGVISSGYVELAAPDNGDYRPVPGSANIDAGENGELPPDAVDLLGNARVMGEYNPDYPPELGGPLYPKMDIGAIEYVFNGDFDGDGVDDNTDAFPSDPSETLDSDSDGVGDNSDAFPNDPNEQFDTDSDGIGNNTDEDDDGDQVADADDAFPLDGSEWLDSDADGIGNNADTDDDNDNVPDSSDAFPLNATESVDTDLDGIGNNADTDDDNDGVLDASDAFPLDATEAVDTDLDGIGNNADTDDDNDGVLDGADAFPLNPAESMDTDLDGIGNNADADDDNDGVLDGDDAFPLDATESVDTDLDGIGNNADTDDDNDGVLDASDAFPLDAAESLDTDLDGIGNYADTDDDNDGVLDSDDAFPLDAAESVDTDKDGIGNNADTDDDNDGVLDSDDAFPLDAAESVDTDKDGIGNNADTDDDNDGVVDSDDAFPLDAAESLDTDLDGIGNNADTDDDNDGVLDSDDAFPLDAAESLDTDLDGIGNNADTDDDNDGVVDSDDAFPLDAAESLDTDLDGIGNNADTDDDNDGVADSDDAFPLDAAESVDTDKDGIGNNADTDDDNDGVLDSDDAFPLDAAESLDTDLDGIGNNADTDDDNDGVVDTEDAFPLDAAESVDTDLDGIGNNADTDDDNDGVLDASDAFPLDATEAVDTDLDGIGNNADTDDDNDGVLDSDDAFPLDASETVDTDGDGIGNNADPDDDNDGIPDEEDAAPLDPNIGDTQKPVFAELAALTFEATGVMTAVTLPEPQVTDNISQTLTISSDLASELALGEHKVVWTATDSAGNSATAEQWVTIVDTTAPEFEELSPLVINASGRLTDISPLLNYSAFDLVDGEVSAVHSGSSELVSGAHELELSATDSSGNTATAMLRLHILPRLKLAKTMTVEAGGSYSVPVQLSGEAPAYPVTMAYSLEVNGVTQPAQSASIASGTSGELMVSIPAGLALNTELLVRVNSISNAFVADDQQTELQLTEQNLAPTISAQVLQQGQPLRVLAPASGEAQIRLSISDVNVNDTHQISWQVVDQAFSGELSADGLSMSFNPNELSLGRYAVDVIVTETNTPEQLSSKRRIRFNVAALAELSATTDTDGDGIVDSIEGYGDSDNDGIADYLDNDVDGSRLPVNSTTESMQTSAGVQLSLGNMTSALISSGAGMTMTDLAESVADNSGAASSEDDHFSQVTAVLDFTLSGQIQPGQSVAVVFPLPHGAALPVDAVYRKYNTSQGWFNFAEDSRNSLGSAPLLDGECPQVGAVSYEPGLVEGYQCVQLLLEDGGPNDADGNANGVIEDPGVIAVLSQNQLPVANLDTASILDTQTLVIDVLANDSDADGDSLSVIAASADNGAVELLADNTLRFSPGSGFSGTAIIRYQVSDGFGGSAQGEVHVTVSLAPVVEPAPPATDTGGGSMPLWSLLLLGLAFTRNRRAAKPQ
ncbi:Ig-like domain-containing protein [Shewanella zhangzhouensis]|uniref:Ig-like domain-containing protein n=1 Tax=Shewanella zhangzhouensis TaxID=2864213 RepID=UPI001C65A9DB|nr:thrombospondin type 3 repeat-containing protein [Shewanella zhangzhouensis]QYK06365.1 thrombospondin type 3 repeat-containing protein [Shewanella zhangzhouensis]